MKQDYKVRITLEKGDDTVAHTMCEASYPEVFLTAERNLEQLKTWFKENQKELEN